MRSAMDECLCVAYSTFKKEKVSAEEVWALYGELGALVVRSSDVETVLAEHSDWGAVSDELSRLTTESKLGLNMFGFAAQLLVSSMVSKVMNEGLATMSGKNISKKSVAALKEAIMAKVNEQKCLDQVPAKRLVTMGYRGLPLGRRVLAGVLDCIPIPLVFPYVAHGLCLSGDGMHMHAQVMQTHLVDMSSSLCECACLGALELAVARSGVMATIQVTLRNTMVCWLHTRSSQVIDAGAQAFVRPWCLMELAQLAHIAH